MKLCLLSAQNHEPKHRIYKLRRKAQLKCKLWTGEERTGAWRVAFMSLVVGVGHTFEEAIVHAKSNSLSCQTTNKR